MRIGLMALLLFIVVRFINIYGDPMPWSVQKDNIYSFLSFMNVTKYPPSLQFCLVTLGFMFLFLAAGERIKGKLPDVITVYGKAPLFYFLVHFFLIHFILLAVLRLQGIHWAWMDFASGNFGRPKEGVSGLPLWQVYIIWIGVVAVLYKPCQWYGNYKATHRNWWLKYL